MFGTHSFAEAGFGFFEISPVTSNGEIFYISASVNQDPEFTMTIDTQLEKTLTIDQSTKEIIL